MATSKENLEMQTDQARMMDVPGHEMRFGGATKPKETCVVATRNAGCFTMLHNLCGCSLDAYWKFVVKVWPLH